MKRLSILFFATCLTALAQTTASPPGPQSQASQAQPPVGRNPASAELGVYVYPRNNQGEAQQQKDESECYNWAKQQTGIDPAAAPQSEPVEAQKAKGGGAKGAAGGAAGGAAIGAIAGDAGTGAAAGATAGAVRGRRQQKKANTQAEQQAQQQTQAQQQESLGKVKNAFSSCMDARGYSAK